MKRGIALIVVALVALPLFASNAVEEGDAHWANRAEGAKGAVASPAPIDAAIAAYRKALSENPNDIEARWKLMRAMRFKGSYTGMSNDAKRDLFDEARTIGKTGLEHLATLLRAKGVSLDDAPEAKVAQTARAIPGAGELIYWDAVSWGEWAQVFGKLAAVRKGAAGKIRRESTITMLMDPGIEDGGGARVLGRLHNQTPHVPFITGWASDHEAVKFLRESLKQDPTNKLTIVFLAEAMVADSRSAKSEAAKMLHEVISSPNDPAYAVEQASAQEDAKKLLKDWGM